MKARGRARRFALPVSGFPHEGQQACSADQITFLTYFEDNHVQRLHEVSQHIVQSHFISNEVSSFYNPDETIHRLAAGFRAQRVSLQPNSYTVELHNRRASFISPKVTLNHGRPIPAVLLANKSDQLASHQPKLDTFCRENGFVGWYETSAKVRKGINVLYAITAGIKS